MFVSRLFQRMSGVIDKKKALIFYEDNTGKSWAAATLAAYGVYKAFSFEVEPENVVILVNHLTHNVARHKVFVEGTYFRIPLLQKTVVYPDHFIRPFKCANKSSEVTLKFLINANPVPEHFPKFYKEVGDNYNSFMEEHIDTALKEVMPDCQAKQFFTEEKAVGEKVKKKLAEKLDGIVAVDEVSFFSVIYGPRPDKVSESRNKVSESPNKVSES